MCVDLVRRRSWPLFAADGRFSLDWSQLRVHPLQAADDVFVSASCGGVEVGRAHLDRRQMSLGAWRGVPDLGPVVRLQLLEVAVDVRGRGVGRAIVRDLWARCSQAQLVAVSVPDASGFWESLGWARCEHRVDGARLPLYVGPLSG
jgi:GNAT superfamily N-acetyltransferase